jgi:hypothetical protein
MGLFKKIIEYLSSPGDEDAHGYRIYARCNRCGEIIETRINLKNDLSIYYGDPVDLKTGGKQPHFFCRKILIGKERCFQQIEVKLTFDQNRNVLDRQILGGEFVTKSEISDG